MNTHARLIGWVAIGAGFIAVLSQAVAAEVVYPGTQWLQRPPAECGVDGAKLDALAEALGGRGCVIKDGYVVKTWGDQAQIGDWFSSAKPVLSTLLFFAIEEGLVKGVDQPIADFGWELKPQHQGITFRHLGAMSSGYARSEGAGEAWAYNDYAIQLYQKTLFDKVFKAHGNEAAAAPHRLGALGFQDGLRFNSKHRLKASVRDFARIAWFWCQKGNWNGRQVLPRHYFDEYMRPQTPKNLPQTERTDTDDDYLGIGSYGGGSDHFSDAGPGIYGFNWWFNDTGRLHPEVLTWPDAPADAFMSIGAGGNNTVIIPSLSLVLASASGNLGRLRGGDPDCTFNRHIRLLVEALTDRRGPIAGTGKEADYFPPPESKGGWRKLEDSDQIRRHAGMDPAKLEDLTQWLLASDDRPFGTVVVRNGYIALEVERDHSSKTDTGDVKSCAKAICATVLAIASDESQKGDLPRKMSFEDAAFDYIPWAQPLSDPRKTRIQVKQLLNHTSGITPEGYGIRNRQPWEYVLGHSGDGKTASLFFDPGTTLQYSTHALYHAALVCENVTGKTYAEFAIECLLKPLGIEKWWFDVLEGDEKHGNHASHTMGVSARDMARIAYCMLRNGQWGERQVIPRWFVDETASPTHSVKGVTKKSFGRNAESWSHGWELPALMGGEMGRDIPRDARFKPGSGGQLIAFVPSLDLVLTRQTGRSGDWPFEDYVRRASACVLFKGPEKPKEPEDRG